MKCPDCGGSNFNWARKCDHCGRLLVAGVGQSAAPRVDSSDRSRQPASPAPVRPPPPLASPGAAGLKVNSLARFSKTSPRLHLEEHGHCEVPAGCGGVVLRWYNPAKGRPILVRVYAPTPLRCFFNGAAVISARPLVPTGEVVLAVEVDAGPPRQGLFIMSATSGDSYDGAKHTDVVARSAGDGTWRFSVTAPPNGWMQPGFDDGAWPALIELPLRPPGADDHRARHVFQQLADVKARPIGLPTSSSSSRIWIRKPLTLAAGRP